MPHNDGYGKSNTRGERMKKPNKKKKKKENQNKQPWRKNNNDSMDYPY